MVDDKQSSFGPPVHHIREGQRTQKWHSFSMGYTRRALVPVEGRALHPIYDCPEDILRLIFEESVTIDEDARFAIATVISHVCGKWRRVALRTPRLWTQILVDAYDDSDALEEFLERTRLRVGSVPVSISLGGVSVNSSTSQFMGCVRIDRYHHIKALHLHSVATNTSTTVDPVFSYSSGPLESLTIQCTTSWHVQWDCSDVFHQFPTAQHIKVIGLHTSLQIGDGDIFPSVLGLTLSDAIIFNLVSQLDRFPNLRHLSLLKEWFEPNSTAKDIILENLVVLQIEGTSFPLERIKAPSLRTLKVTSNSTELIDFVRRHNTIRTLHCCLLEEEFRTLAVDADQLEHINIKGNTKGIFQVLCTRTRPFPNLKKLSIRSTASPNLPLKEFESFVQVRCLLENHEYGVNIKTLKIRGYNKDLEKAPWRKSSLLALCQQTLEVSKDEKAECTLSMIWNN